MRESGAEGEEAGAQPPSRRLWRRLTRPVWDPTQERDRWVLSDLVQLYALAVDDCDLETVVDMFAPDGEFDRAGVTTRGRAALEAFFAEMMSGYRTTTHVPQSLVVVLDGDHAEGVATGSAELVNADGSLLLASYRYDDRYAREGGVWRFRRRSLRFHHVLPADGYATGMAGRDRIRRAPGQAAPGDYPEAFETWRRRHAD